MSTVFSSALLLVVPLILAALGGLLHSASGVINIGLEGQMLVGALMGVVFSAMTGNWVVGVLAAVVVSAVCGLLMTFVITRLKANEIIVGLGFNILVAGIIGFVLRWKLGVSGTLRPEGLERIPHWNIPGISEVPIVRELVDGKDAIYVLTLVLVPVTAWLLRNSRYGIRLRASGDSPDAASSLGINVKLMRESAGFIAGALAGLGGAYLALVQVGLFNSELISGRGFIALAAFYFGRNKPFPTALACVLFAIFDAWQVTLQTGSALGSLFTTMPYLIVVVALALGGYRQKYRHRKAVSA